jgi:hypothetical protein
LSAGLPNDILPRSTSGLPPGTIGYVELTATATIWAMFACFLLFPHLGLPRLLHRTAMALLVAELVALGIWSYGSQGCVERPCSTLAETGRTAAALDVPLLSAGLIALAALHGVFSWRRARQRVAG